MTAIEYRTCLEYLSSEPGRSLLIAAQDLPEDRLVRLTHLRRKHSADLAQVVVEQLELRRRGKAKFSRSNEMLFTAEGLEQSTSERVADYRASLFPSGCRVLDACCGIGGDAIALAQRAETLAVDSNPAVAFCARHNLSISNSHLAVQRSARVLCSDVASLDLGAIRASGFAFAFFDPSRRKDSKSGGRARVADSQDYSPPLSWISELKKHFEGVLVKVSPAIDDETLIASGGRVEFVSERGECKEALLKFGEFEDNSPLSPAVYNSVDPYQPQPKYTATLLSKDGTALSLHPFDCPPISISEPKQWLYEPDPAVIRAHLLSELGSMTGVSQISPEIAYLTSAHEIDTPFASAYKIRETLPCNFKKIQAKLHQLGGRITVVKKRGVLYDPDEVRKSLKPCGDAEFTLTLTMCKGKQIAMICEPRMEKRF